ncbi:MAG TPA: FecR family protein [Kofleriaceae bacterium]|nr:FecR family protein [Kofleriaceae bacterium]
MDEAERATMERHARRCRDCARVRQRVTRASDSFAAIRTQSVPDVPWDAIRARVHWSVSTERQAALRRRRPAYGWLAAATAAGAAIGLAVNAWAPLDSGEPAAPDRRLAAQFRPEPSAAPATLIGLVSRASGDVMVDGVRPDDLFARQLTQGSSLATGDGRLDVQFGTDSAFALGPMSTLRLHRFDARTIELAVDGTLDVVVAPRAGGQQFLVDAGDQVVEVRGTQFRVVHDAGGTRVACHHGLVTVRDPTGIVELAAEQRLAVAAGHPVSAERPVALSADEAAAFDRAPPLSLPLWDPVVLPRSSAPLEIATAGRHDVRVDGIELGVAPLRVRVMPGRHSVETADSAGRFRRGWVDVAAAPRGARFEVPAEPPPTGGITERRHQLRAGTDQARLRSCTRSIAKAGLTGTYVQIEIAVDPEGAVGFLNVLDTDLPSATASCVRDVLASVRFRPGAAATWRERIDL